MKYNLNSLFYLFYDYLLFYDYKKYVEIYFVSTLFVLLECIVIQTQIRIQIKAAIKGRLFVFLSCKRTYFSHQVFFNFAVFF